MQTRIPLTCVLVALSTLLAGCARKKPDEGGVGPPPDATDVVSEAQQAMEHFGEGPYLVCDLGTRMVHAPFKGDHLNIGDEVRLSNTASGLKLKLGDKEIDVVPSNSGRALKGESTFEHEPSAGGTPLSKTLEKHQVGVTKSIGYTKPQAPAPACDPEKPNSTIIDVEFCPEKTGGGWDCNPDNFHQGDVHAQG